MGKAIDIFCVSGLKYPIHILAPTFSTVSDELGSFVLTLIIQCFYHNLMVLAKVVTFKYMFYRYYKT